MTHEPAPVQPTQTQTVTITGVRVTRGNAVECPQVRDDAGNLHTVSYLSPTAPVGTRVQVSGFYGVTVACLGTVLIVRQAQILPD